MADVVLEFLQRRVGHVALGKAAFRANLVGAVVVDRLRIVPDHADRDRQVGVTGDRLGVGLPEVLEDFQGLGDVVLRLVDGGEEFLAEFHAGLVREPGQQRGVILAEAFLDLVVEAGLKGAGRRRPDDLVLRFVEQLAGLLQVGDFLQRRRVFRDRHGAQGQEQSSHDEWAHEMNSLNKQREKNLHPQDTNRAAGVTRVLSRWRRCDQRLMNRPLSQSVTSTTFAACRQVICSGFFDRETRRR